MDSIRDRHRGQDQERITIASFRLLLAGESSLSLPLLKSESNNSPTLCLLYGVCALIEENIQELDTALFQYSSQYLNSELDPTFIELTGNYFGEDYTFIGIAGMEQVLYFFLSAVFLIESKKDFLHALQVVYQAWQAWEHYNRTIRPFTWYELPDFFSGIPLGIAQLGLNLTNLLSFNEDRNKWYLRCRSLSDLNPISWYKITTEEKFVLAPTYSKDIRVLKHTNDHRSKEYYTKKVKDHQNYLVSICLPNLPQTTQDLHSFLSSVIKQSGYQNIEILCGASSVHSELQIKNYSSVVRHVAQDQLQGSNLLDLIGESLGDYVAIITRPAFLSKAYLAQAIKPLVAGDADIITFGGVRKKEGAHKASVVARTVPLDLTCVLRHAELPFASYEHDYIASERNELQITSAVLPFGLITSRELLLQFISPSALFSNPATLMHFFGILAYLFRRTVAVIPAVRIRDFELVETVVDKQLQAFEALSIGFLLYEENVFVNKIVPLVKEVALQDFNLAWDTFIGNQAALISLQKKIWLTADRSLQGWWQEVAQCLGENLPLHKMIALSEGSLSDILPRINSRP